MKLDETVNLRIPEITDADHLFQLRTNPEVNQYLDRTPPATIREVEEFIENRRADQQAYYFIIDLLPEHTFAGTICLWNINRQLKSAEVGFELLPAFQGKGIMTTAIGKIIQQAFQHGELEIIEAYTKKENHPSRALLERMGFKPITNREKPGPVEYIKYVLQKSVH